jgi:parallel beta-helix repeat protein
LWTPTGGHDWLLVDNADRLIDWSNAGVWYNTSNWAQPWNGVKGIPTYPRSGGDTHNVMDYGAHADGVTNDLDHLQAAVTAASAGDVVYLPGGTYGSPVIYRITGQWTINKAVVLRGDGAGKTIVLVNFDNSTGIYFAGSQSISSTYIASGCTKGSSQIVVDDGSIFQAGDIVILDQYNDPALVFGSCSYCGFDGEGGVRSAMESAIVTAVAGNTITLNHPQYMTRTTIDGNRPRITRQSRSPLINAGIENLTINAVSGTTATRGLRFGNAMYCWANKVEVKNMPGHSIELRWGSHGIEIRRTFLHDASSTGAGAGYACDLMGSCSECLIEDNISDRNHTGVCWQYCSGNVIGYNYCNSILYYSSGGYYWLQCAYGDHGKHCYMNLTEGNWGDQYKGDAYWGSASHEIQFRNHFSILNPCAPTVYQNLVSYMVFAWHYYFTAVGNVFGDPTIQSVYGYPQVYQQIPYLSNNNNPVLLKIGYAGESDTGYPDDANTAATMVLHGNYDYADEETKWDGSITSHSIPNSLYYTNKPSWWGSLTWPAIGPDVAGYSVDFPARKRWNDYVISGSLDDIFKDMS